MIKEYSICTCGAKLSQDEFLCPACFRKNESWTDDEDKKIEALLDKGAKIIDTKTSSAYMADILINYDYPTHGIYEELRYRWKHGSPEYRACLSSTLSLLTGESLKVITENLIKEAEENAADDTGSASCS